MSYYSHHSSGQSSRSQAAPTGLMSVLARAESKKKFTQFSWVCRVATILPLSTAIWDEIFTKQPPNLTLSQLMKGYSEEILTTLAEEVNNPESIDYGIFYALYISPMCQGGKAETLWPAIHRIKSEMHLDIPNPSQDFWEENLSFLVDKFPDPPYKEYLTPKEAGAEVEGGVVEGNSGRKAKGKGGKRARATEQEAPKKTKEDDAYFISKCPSACISDTFLAVVLEGATLQQLSDKVTSMFREDEARCSHSKTELKPLLAESSTLRKPLSKEPHVLDEKISDMDFDRFHVHENEKLAAIVERCKEKRGAMLEAHQKIEHHREECVALDVSTKSGRDKAADELRKVEADLMKKEEICTKAEADFNKQFETVLEALTSLNLSKFERVKAKISFQKAELPLRRMEDTLRGLEDASSVTMRELMEAVGELQFEVPKNTRMEGIQEAPHIDIDLLTDDTLPDSVPELQKMVMALRANLAKEQKMREEQEQKMALEEEARKTAEANVAKMYNINKKLQDQVQVLRNSTPVNTPPTQGMKKLKLKGGPSGAPGPSQAPKQPGNTNKSQGKQGKGGN